MNGMRLFALLAVVPACASAPTTHAPLSAVAPDPGPESVVAADAPYHPPYAMLFHEGNSWTLPVHAIRVAMIERAPQGEVTCTVEHVEQYCDRRISNVTCEGDGSKLLAGKYSASWDGLWKAELADYTSELDERSMLIARLPPFPRTAGHPDPGSRVVSAVSTKPWGAAWCISDTGADDPETLCIQPGKGLIGAADDELVIGQVPRSM